MPGGRPTKYSSELMAKAREYLEGAYADDGSVIPSNVGLALFLDIGTTTLERWKGDEDKDEFRAILDDIQAKQQRLLINEGLKGNFNAAIAKLALGKHGFSEKSENTHSLSPDTVSLLGRLEGMSDDQLKDIEGQL